ncbi:retrovirus-related Pol polyprotein from transposon 412 [Trichonephila clavipes]|uniref:Retrovirus-related Pol polyprotein from transposon 412 n=1 Tax=Trichonephila clavipes TaxID=2585209 RepID=A0A8X6SXD2_TRICX|nr:retrovirus-related Pol polyprotein from transposon 412 [Trichonephila clavipes]
MILEGLTDGLPFNLRQLLTISPPSNPTEGIISDDQNALPQIVIENRCELSEIRSHYDSIFSKDKYDVGQLRVEPQRIILKSDLIVHLRPYRTSTIQEKEIKGQVEKLLQAGLIKESNSPYSAPVTLAFKRDESKKTRLCINFRKLNALCKAYSEPLPIMDSLLDKLTRAKRFSTLDLASGYWHVPIHPKDTEILAFCTNFGLYEWCRLPFGIKGSTNIEADMLPRHPVVHHLQYSSHLLDINVIKTHQKNDNLCGPKYHEIKDLITLKQMVKMNVSINLLLLDLNASPTSVSWAKRPTRTTQPTSRIGTLTSTFAGLKEDTCSKDSLAADQR